MKLKSEYRFRPRKGAVKRTEEDRLRTWRRVWAATLVLLFVAIAGIQIAVDGAHKAQDRADLLGESLDWQTVAYAETVVELESMHDALAMETSRTVELTDELTAAEARAEEASKTIEKLERELEAAEASKTSSTSTPGGWTSSRASWYGSAFYGNTMAGGGTYGPDTWGVAHKALPFGTKLRISYNGQTVTVPVTDRGPYTPGRDLDLSYAVAQALGFSGVQTVSWAVVR